MKQKFLSQEWNTCSLNDDTEIFIYSTNLSLTHTI